MWIMLRKQDLVLRLFLAWVQTHESINHEISFTSPKHRAMYICPPNPVRLLLSNIEIWVSPFFPHIITFFWINFSVTLCNRYLRAECYFDGSKCACSLFLWWWDFSSQCSSEPVTDTKELIARLHRWKIDNFSRQNGHLRFVKSVP